jgi:ADP-ribose pyrophosphatase
MSKLVSHTDVIRGFEVVGDEKAGGGGFLEIRRLRVKIIRADGTPTAQGLYDFIERPVGLDAVVIALFHRRSDGIDVLLREAVRVPVVFGRPESGLRTMFELVAGILEVGEDDFAALQKRAAAEAHEEAGLILPPESFSRLGPPLFPTPGMCAEKFHFAAAEVKDPGAAVRPIGDGSPFEEGARLHWIDLDQALEKFARGDFDDMKTELGLRRLKSHLG